MKQHDNSSKNERDKSEYFNWGRPMREIMPALEKLTGQSQGWMEINFADQPGYGSMHVRLKRTLFLNHAQKWADWWSKNWQEFLPNEADAQLQETCASLERCTASIAGLAPAKPAKEIPCGSKVAIGVGRTMGTNERLQRISLAGLFGFGYGSDSNCREGTSLTQSHGGEPTPELAAWAERGRSRSDRS